MGRIKGTFTLTASSDNPDAFSRECQFCHMRICSTRGPSGVPDEHAKHERECELDYIIAKNLYEAKRDLEMWDDIEWEDLEADERYAWKWAVGRMFDFGAKTVGARLELDSPPPPSQEK